MTINLATIDSALFSRAASDAAGAAFRATLGGASSVFGAHRLPAYRDPGAAGRPARVWSVWRSGDVGGRSGRPELRTVRGAWWVYDDPERGIARINTTIAALEALYGDRFAIAGGRLEVEFVGRQFEDTALSAIGRELRIAYIRL